MAHTYAKEMLRDALVAIAGPDDELGQTDDVLPALTDYLTAFAAPDFECAMYGLPPTPPTVYPGVDGVTKGWTEYGEAFTEVAAKMERVAESERSLVVLVEQVAVTHTGGVEMSQPSAMAFLFDESGKVARLEFPLDREEALRSAGIDPGS